MPMTFLSWKARNFCVYAWPISAGQFLSGIMRFDLRDGGFYDLVDGMAAAWVGRLRLLVRTRRHGAVLRAARRSIDVLRARFRLLLELQLRTHFLRMMDKEEEDTEVSRRNT